MDNAECSICHMKDGVHKMTCPNRSNDRVIISVPSSMIHKEN